MRAKSASSRELRVFLRFCIVGAAGFIADGGVLAAAVYLGRLSPLAARALSAPLAVLLTFVLNRSWSFVDGARTSVWRELLSYVAVQATGLASNLLVYTFAIAAFPAPLNNPFAALTLASATALALNYVGARFIVFRPRQQAARQRMECSSACLEGAAPEPRARDVAAASPGWACTFPSQPERRTLEDVPVGPSGQAMSASSHRFQPKMTRPANYRQQDAAELQARVEYALATVQTTQSVLQRCGLQLPGIRLLELGPGSDFGAQLILASMGAEVVLADRFLAKWDDGYHPAFYALLSQHWAGPKAQLETVLHGRSHESSSLLLLEEPAEDLHSVSDDSVDFVYSNAVLEHIVDIRAVAEETARVLKPGSWAAHQIDWRHHENFDRPLEHLVLPEDVFIATAEAAHYECGNRLRSSEFWGHFESAGLRVFDRDVDSVATQAYLDDLVPRLRASLSRYRHWPEADLGRLSGRFVLRKEVGPEAAMTRARGQDVVALQAALMAAGLAPDGAGTGGPKDEAATLELDLDQLTHDSGFCWRIDLPDLPAGDTAAERFVADLRLTEEGRPLGPAHAFHHEIRTKGRGRYSHWHHELYFSASDNTSPLTNGRRYALEIRKAWLMSRTSGDL
jgi:putative flippase GtrA/SAM-dependent methyltransferase